MIAMVGGYNPEESRKASPEMIKGAAIGIYEDAIRIWNSQEDKSDVDFSTFRKAYNLFVREIYKCMKAYHSAITEKRLEMDKISSDHRDAVEDAEDDDLEDEDLEDDYIILEVEDEREWDYPSSSDLLRYPVETDEYLKSFFKELDEKEELEMGEGVRYSRLEEWEKLLKPIGDLCGLTAEKARTCEELQEKHKELLDIQREISELPHDEKKKERFKKAYADRKDRFESLQRFVGYSKRSAEDYKKLKDELQDRINEMREENREEFE